MSDFENEKGEVTSLDFHGRFRDSILSGCKKISIRIGERKLAKNITVEGFHAIVENFYTKKLKEVDFKVFQNEGWNNIDEMLQVLRSQFYPGIELDSVVTIIEFRLEIPHRPKA